MLVLVLVLALEEVALLAMLSQDRGREREATFGSYSSQ